MKSDLERDLEGLSKGDFRGDSKQDMEGDLLSKSGQVWSRSGSIFGPNFTLLSLTLS